MLIFSSAKARVALGTSLVVLAALWAGPAAPMGGGGHRSHDGAGAPRGGRTSGFRPPGARPWHDGRWVNGHHGGRLGWWWVAGGAWYLYPEPVYPYPDPMWPPSVALVNPPVPTAEYWYYCEAVQAYYPYVAACPGGWVQMQVTPGGPAPPALK